MPKGKPIERQRAMLLIHQEAALSGPFVLLRLIHRPAAGTSSPTEPLESVFALDAHQCREVAALLKQAADILERPKERDN